MIHRQSHTIVYVLDQERARKFYVEKLGLEVRKDEKMGDMRWLTVGPGAEPELEIVLMPAVTNPMLDASSAETLRGLIKKGALGGGVFATDDCKTAYETLKERGVQFISPPAERPYGIEAVFKDDSGNWFSICQQRR